MTSVDDANEYDIIKGSGESERGRLPGGGMDYDIHKRHNLL